MTVISEVYSSLQIPTRVRKSICLLFLDFSRRIYYFGLLYFYEYDISRSLINFASFGNHKKVANDSKVMEAFLYHYKSYPSIEDGLTYFGVLMMRPIIWI